MADRIQIQYEYSEEDEYYAKLTLGNSSVAVGEAAGAGDQTDWEIIDCFNGKQLAFRRITGDHTTPDAVWAELMTKAHHLLLDLHRQAVEQAQRDEEFRSLYSQLQDTLSNSNTLLEMNGWNGMTAGQLSSMRTAVNLACECYEKLDDAYDPPE